MISRAAVALGLVAVAFGCATSPLGRKQLLIVPDSQMNTMGAQAFQEMKSSIPVENDPATNSFVRCVALPITDAAKGRVPVSSWEIVVFREESANAFALPGGKIGVHTGILKVAQNDSQLAAVLGHEVAHVIAKHGAERVSQAFAAQGGLVAIGAVTSNNPNRDKILALLGLGTQVGILLPHGRTQETEADLVGLDLMASAGFDPRQSVELWKNMKKASRGPAPPEWLSTHPANETRISELESRMPEALRLVEHARAAGRSPRCAHP